jgi:hypothetical protein
MKSRKRNGKPAQKAFETSEFDREFVIENFKPLSSKERAQWERIQERLQRDGHPGQGSKAYWAELTD